MNTLFLAIFTFLYTSTFSQTIEHIDKLIYQVNNTSPTDSITIVDSANRMSRPERITGYLSGDTLTKSITRFKGLSRIRLTYYDRRRTIYVKDYDSTTNELYMEVYNSADTILKSTIVNLLDTDENDLNQLIYYSLNPTKIAFALVRRNAKNYHFKVKLTTALSLPPGCGGIAFALLQKFEVLSTDFPSYDKKFVLIIECCPEFLKDHFFRDGGIYEVDVATNSGVTFEYSYHNNYEKEDLPVFWSQKIVRVK